MAVYATPNEKEAEMIDHLSLYASGLWGAGRRKQA
jgi:hypothetical protein